MEYISLAFNITLLVNKGLFLEEGICSDRKKGRPENEVSPSFMSF